MLEPAHKSRHCVLKPAYFTTISSFFFKILLYSFLSAVEKPVLFAPTLLRALWDFPFYHSHKPCYNKHSCTCFSHSLSLFLKSHLWSFFPGQEKKKKWDWCYKMFADFMMGPKCRTVSLPQINVLGDH